MPQRYLHASLLDALDAAARLEHRHAIRVLPERESGATATLTYRALYDDALRIATGLESLGVRRGDRVLIVLPTCAEFLSVFFATQVLGAIAVPVYPPTESKLEGGLERLAHVARHAGTKVCVTSSLIAPVLGVLGHDAPCVAHVVEASSLRGAPHASPARLTADDACFVQYTSGSTGMPKGVLLTHGNLVANVHAIGQSVHIDEDDVVVGWCPLYHDMGLIGTFLFAVYFRIGLVLLSPTAFLMRPRRWLRAISDFRGTLSPAPNFGYALATRRVKPEEREGLDLSRWRVAFNGAEPVTTSVVSTFIETYAAHGFREDAMFPVYGLAESSLAVTFPELGTKVRAVHVDRIALAEGRVVEVDADSERAAAVVSTGKAMPGHVVSLLTDDGRPAREGAVGHVVVSGPSIMHGYYEDPATTAESLEHGRLRTGDLGFLHAGELFVTGRVKDTIVVRGKNYCSEDVERVVERIEGLRPGGVVAFGLADHGRETERVVVVCETLVTETGRRDAIVEEVSTRVLKAFGFAVDEVSLVAPGSIPKTSSGKRQRRSTRLAYQTGTLRPRKTSTLASAWVALRAATGAVRLRARTLLGGRTR